MDEIICISDEEEEEMLPQARVEDVGSDPEETNYESDETASQAYVEDADSVDTEELVHPTGRGLAAGPTSWSALLSAETGAGAAPTVSAHDFHK